MSEEPKKILYLVQLPPPVHGVSIMNKLVTNSPVINDSFLTRLIEIRFSNKIEELRHFTLRKFGIFFITLFKLKWALITFRPDLIYFSLIPVGKGFIRDAMFAVIIKLFNKKVIFHLNNRGIPLFQSKPLYRFLYKLVFRNSAIIHVSKGLLETEIKPLKIKNSRYYVIGNTIEPFALQNRQEQDQTIRILFLSNFFREKGLMILLEAMCLLKRREKSIILYAFGATRKKEEIVRYKKFVEANNLSDSVLIYGPVYGKKKNIVFENADLFVFPSYFEEECFPLTILEAMNAKLPIIATKIGAIPEMIEEGKEGFLIEPHNPEQLADRMEILIKDTTRRQKMGLNAHSKFNREFAYPVFQKKMRTVFESELSGKK